MLNYAKRLSFRLLLAVIIFIASGIIVTNLVKAQGGLTITATGEIQAINSDGTIVIDGTTFKLGEGVSLPPGTQVGSIVTVTAQYQDATTITITIITLESVTSTPAPTGTASAMGTPMPNGDVIIVIEGPVQTININIITIYDIDIIIAPESPFLRVIQVGDFVHVEGTTNATGAIVATVITNAINSIGATVSLEGQVESINGNVVIINGIGVRFDPNDPVFVTLKVGDIITVEGNFEGNGPTLILIVVNVIVVNNVVIINNGVGGLPPGCWYHKNGKIKCTGAPSNKGSNKKSS